MSTRPLDNNDESFDVIHSNLLEVHALTNPDLRILKY